MGQCLTQCCNRQGAHDPDLNLSSDIDIRYPSNQARSRYIADVSVPVVKDSSAGGEPKAELNSNPGADWKMFTPYSKLPPIKKQVVLEVQSMPLDEKDISESKIIAMFDSYKDLDEDSILAEGIEKFCSEI